MHISQSATASFVLFWLWGETSQPCEQHSSVSPVILFFIQTALSTDFKKANMPPVITVGSGEKF